MHAGHFLASGLHEFRPDRFDRAEALLEVAVHVAVALELGKQVERLIAELQRSARVLGRKVELSVWGRPSGRPHEFVAHVRSSALRLRP